MRWNIFESLSALCAVPLILTAVGCAAELNEEQIAAAQREKAVYQKYVETAGMENGEVRQMDFVLEGLEVEEGDAFAVSLAEGVPADLSQYREFSEPPS